MSRSLDDGCATRCVCIPVPKRLSIDKVLRGLVADSVLPCDSAHIYQPPRHAAVVCSGGSEEILKHLYFFRFSHVIDTV